MMMMMTIQQQQQQCRRLPPLRDLPLLPMLWKLDDWLETHRRDNNNTPVLLTRVVIFVLSSFGMGGAPMNAKLFRRRCDDLIEDY
jgi:hypothetical protein